MTFPPAETSTTGGEPPVFSVRRWPGMRSEYGRYPPTEQVTVTKPQQIGVSFVAHPHVAATSGGRGQRLTIRPGDVFATGKHPIYWSEVAEPDEVVEIYPDDALLRAAAGTSSPVEIEPVMCGRDAAVLAVASTLRRAHLLDGHLDDVHASTLAHRLAEHLVAYYGGHRPSGERLPGRLDRPSVNRVAELVEDRLGDRLTIDELASAATLSPFHFARSFKAATGMSPHEFVMDRRIERAKALLQRTELSVADVAYAVGYSNLSHFRRVFRRITGIAPSDLRAR